MPSSAPLFAATLNDLDDKPVALERYKGKPLIVNFWAAGAVLPGRNSRADQVPQCPQGQGRVLGIGIEDKAEPAKEFAKAYDMDYPVFVAKGTGIPLMQALGNTKAGLPYTLFIDRHGNVDPAQDGRRPQAGFDSVQEALFKK